MSWQSLYLVDPGLSVSQDLQLSVISLITCLGLGCFWWLGAGFGDWKLAGRAAWYHGQSWGDLQEA